MAKAAKRVAVTGAAGQIAYSLLFRIANGDLLGKDQPVILQLLDLPQAQAAVKGVVMELEDCAFPLLSGVVITDDPKTAFKDADVALLVGARPRSKGMERKDLLTANAEIFTVQGRALNDAAKLPFIEVHIATSLAECEKRDPKGLYARARSGELKGLTGVDAPYEPPETPDLVLDTTGADIDELAAQVIALLDERSPRAT